MIAHLTSNIYAGDTNTQIFLRKCYRHNLYQLMNGIAMFTAVLLPAYQLSYLDPDRDYTLSFWYAITAGILAIDFAVKIGT